MQAAAIEQQTIVWQPAKDAELGANDVRIAIAYAGINRADLMQVAGNYPPPPGASDIPGLECSGVVTETGSAVSHLSKGDRVAALLAAGGYADSVVVNAQQVVPVPASWSLQEAAGWLETFATAHMNVFQLAQLQPHEVVFAHAGASGVGTSLIQLCRESGNRIYVTAGSEEKCQFCQQLGADLAINRHTQSVVDELRKTDGVDVILNPVAGASIANDQKYLNADGRIILIGLMGGREGTVDFGRMLMKRQRILGSTLRALPSDRKGAVLQTLWQEFADAFEARRIYPMIDCCFARDDVNKALDYVASNQSQGKVILEIAGE